MRDVLGFIGGGLILVSSAAHSLGGWPAIGSELAKTNAPADLAKLEGHTDFARAAPTPDHFIPLLYIAGLASAAGQTADVLVDGYAMGSLSMASYTLGGHELDVDSERGAPPLPDVPADETNI